MLRSTGLSTSSAARGSIDSSGEGGGRRDAGRRGMGNRGRREGKRRSDMANLLGRYGIVRPDAAGAALHEGGTPAGRGPVAGTPASARRDDEQWPARPPLHLLGRSPPRQPGAPGATGLAG